MPQHTVRLTEEDDTRVAQLRERAERDLGFRPSLQQALTMCVKCGLDVFENRVRHIVAELAEVADNEQR